jgi:hypothetical protein
MLRSGEEDWKGPSRELSASVGRNRASAATGERDNVRGERKDVGTRVVEVAGRERSELGG